MKRRKRFTPDRSRTAFYNTPYKEEVLELLAQYKYLRSHSIRALLPHRSPRGMSASLRVLFDEGLIDKPKEARRGYNNLYSPDIYMLAPKGEQYLIDRGRNPKAITRLYRRGVINVTRIADVLDAYEHPPYDWGSETAWRLFNAVTFALTGRVAEDPTITRRLHEVIDGFCEPVDRRQLALPALA